MPEDVIERMTIEMVADASKILDEFIEEKKKVETAAVELRDNVKKVMSEGEIMDVLAGTAREMNITLQEAAEKWQNLGAVGFASLEELNGVLARWDERVAVAAPLIEKAIGGLAEQAAKMGVNLTDAQLDERSQEMLRLATHSSSVAEAIAKITVNALQASQGLSQMAQAGPGGTDAGAWEAWAAPKPAARQAGPGDLIKGVIGANLKSITGAVTAATGLYTIGQKLVQLFRESAVVAVESSEAFTQVALAVRANQRAFGESIGTIEDYQALVGELAGRYAVSEIAVAKATSRLLAQNLTLGLNKNQLQAVTESAIVFAEVYDRDVTGVMTAFTQFLNTGVKQGISNFGLDLEKLELQAGKTFGEMSRQERIMALLPELMEKTGAFAEDLAQREETLAGQMERMNVETEKWMKTLGTFTSVIELGLKRAWLTFVQAITAGFALLSMAVVQGITEISRFITILGQYALARKEGISREEAWATALETGNRVAQETHDMLAEQLGRALALTDGIMDDAAASAANLSWELEILGENADDAAAAFIEMAEEYGKALDKLEERLRDTINKIGDDLRKAEKDAQQDLVDDLIKIDQAAAERRLNVVQENQVREERMRQDHLLAMRRLEEDYLLELEDAVRERDARQVLMLMRRYNLERQRREEDYALRQKRMRFDFQLELAEIEYQRRQRQALRIQEYNLELEELRAQAAEKRVEAIDNFEKEKRALLDEQKKKLDLLQGGMEAERDLRITYMTQFYQDMLAYYGPNGYLEAVYSYAAKAQATYLNGISTTLKQMSMTTWQSIPEGYGLPSTTKAAKEDPFARTAGETQFASRYYQRGGEFIATSPTPIMVGERPEAVSVTPLSGNGGAVAGFQAGGGEPIELRVMVDAEEGLAVRVADQAMSRVADVVVSITKHAPGGARV